MSDDPSFRDILRNGFQNETQVRNALNHLFSLIFEEFFKLVGAILVLSALEIASQGERFSVPGALVVVGKLFLTLKVFSLLGSFFQESMFDVLEHNNRGRGRVRRFLSVVIGFIVFYATFSFASSAVDFFVGAFSAIEI